jgi:hypothetical protein
VSHLGIKCQSVGAVAGEINISALEGQFGFIKQGSAPAVGLALTPATGHTVAHLACGEVPIEITGGMIGAYAVPDRMVDAFDVTFESLKGKQIPSSFEGGPAAVLEMAAGGHAAEPVALAAKDKSTNREWLEIKALP